MAPELPSSRRDQTEGVSGVMNNGVFWSFEKPVSVLVIEHADLLKRARKAEKILAFLSGTLFLGLFLVGVFVTDPKELLLPEYWLEPNAGLFILSLSLLSLLFVAYRNVRDHEEGMMLPKKGTDAMPQTVASLPVAHADIFRVLDDEAKSTIEDAFMLAYRSGSLNLSPLHLFAAALGTTSGQVLLARLGLSLEGLKDALRRKLSLEEKGPTVFGSRAEEMLAQAFFHGLETRRHHLGALDLLAVTFLLDPFFIELFEEKGIKADELENALAWMRVQDDLEERYKTLRKAAALKPTGNMDRAMTAVATPFLDAVSEDLTRSAVYGKTGILVGREGEMTALFRAIEGGQQNVILVGQPGVGRGALIEGIADLMVEEAVPAILQDKRLLKLSVPHIVSAEGGQGAEERFLYALEQVGHSGNIVLVIEDIHELVGAGGGGVDLASILATELEKGYTFVIATTTPEGYTNAVERSVLQPKFTRINVEEPSRNDAIRIVESKVGGIEARNNVIFTYGALQAAVDLSSRYMHDSVLPQKAIELIKEVALTVSKRGEKFSWVKKEDVAALVGEKTKIPVSDVTKDEGEKLLKLEEKLHERVIGQEAAIKSVSAALRRARAAMRSEGKPIANFLFLGPTGVGKTELAKATAEVFFGSEQSMVRFDMSEYQNKESVTRLIGGNGEAGLMTEAVRRNPFALLLLDELEKAHPDILNLFLQVMDDGRLTDGTGRTIDFTNIILIATSNAGTQYIEDETAKGTSLVAIKDALLNKELRQLYRPEFLNRFNEVIVFTPLTEADVTAIAYLIIEKVKKRMEAKSITLNVTDEAVHELAFAGYDPKFGARPLKRVVEERLENILADEFLKGSFGRRDTVTFDAGGRLEVRKAEQL
jgi:ATP-dependent Clp protease ATP-binding subunit ClpC